MQSNMKRTLQLSVQLLAQNSVHSLTVMVDKHVTLSEVKTWTLETRVSVTPAELLVSTAHYQLLSFMTAITIEGGEGALSEQIGINSHLWRRISTPSDAPRLKLRISASHCNPKIV